MTAAVAWVQFVVQTHYAPLMLTVMGGVGLANMATGWNPLADRLERRRG